jgi:hypothetical protein
MKISLRLSGLALSVIGFVLVGGAAHGQATFSMTGKAATGSGAFVDLPAAGNQPCPSIKGQVGFATMVPATMTGFLFPPPPAGSHNPAGCIPGGPAAVMTNGAGGFTIPAGFFNQPFPGGPGGGTAANLNVTAVPNIPRILQLATSFQFTGPQAVPFEPLNPVNSMAPNAPWRVFGNNAWVNQTGRAGLNFTACGGNAPAYLACTKPSQGAVPAILKNIGGANGFGGTMGLVLTTSPTQQSSMIVKAGAQNPNGTVAVAIVGGMGSRAAGRGYAVYDTDFLQGGPVFLMYMLTTAVPPPNNVVASVMTPFVVAPNGKNYNWGFPFTTGTIIARGTGSTTNMAPANQTVTAMGFDTTTPMGQRNIQLVAGGVAQSTVQGPNGTPNYTVVRLPEPGAAMQLFAGMAGLLAIAVWRTRKAR